tara:strand:+ start:95 stop:514 length:420 start_codon:yes stop_codon:yes gene_type:complete
MYTVYELRTILGKLEYFGYSKNINAKWGRLYQHTKKKQGLFYGREDLVLNELKTFATRKEAGQEEGRLKLLHGMEWTEKEVGRRNGLTGGIKNRKITMEEAIEIRSKYIPRKNSYVKLAKEYNISKSSIVRITKNMSYT